MHIWSVGSESGTEREFLIVDIFVKIQTLVENTSYLEQDAMIHCKSVTSLRSGHPIILGPVYLVRALCGM